MKVKPVVSVIIPTFNYAHYISEAIQSVFDQSYPKELTEIIVVDDGSTDDTQQVLRHWTESGDVKYFYQPNQGKAAATALAVRQSSGQYIFNLDADDYFFENKIETTVAVFETDSDIVHVASAAHFFHDHTQALGGIEKLPDDIAGRVIDGGELLDYFYHNNIFYGGGSTYAARASVLKQIIIPAGVDMYIDEFLMLAILPFGKSFLMPAPLSAWRVHASNYSGKTHNAEIKKQKNERLLRSSEAILNYLVENRFDNKIIKIYRVKDAIRALAFKESMNQKSINDTWIFAKLIFIKLRPGAKIIRKYQVLNRLLPTAWLKMLKKLTAGTNK